MCVLGRLYIGLVDENPSTITLPWSLFVATTSVYICSVMEDGAEYECSASQDIFVTNARREKPEAARWFSLYNCGLSWISQHLFVKGCRPELQAIGSSFN